MTKLTPEASFCGCILTSSSTLTGAGAGAGAGGLAGAEAVAFTSSGFGAKFPFKTEPTLKDNC